VVEPTVLSVDPDERWRRIEASNAEATGAVPITRDHLEGWERFLDASFAGEIAVFDSAGSFPDSVSEKPHGSRQWTRRRASPRS